MGRANSGAIVAAASGPAEVVDLGPAPPSIQLRVAIILNCRNVASLRALVALQGNPDSPFFRHFLTPAQFQASFSPTPADYAKVISALQAGGFGIAATYRNKMIIDAVGTVASINKFFATRVERASKPGVGLGYINVTPAYEPAIIRGEIYGVAGLSTLPFENTSRLSEANYRSLTFNEKGLSESDQSPMLNGPVGGYAPFVFERAYQSLFQQYSVIGSKFVATNSDADGSGRATGIVAPADYVDSDLDEYLKHFAITRTGPATVRVPIDGGGSANVGSLRGETTLDVEAVVSTAPGTALFVYETPGLIFADVIDAYAKIVDDNKADVVSSSFGECEQLHRGDGTMMDMMAMSGASLGQTFVAATGDNGATPKSCDPKGKYAPTPGVAVPASSPNFVAVGGTTLEAVKGAWKSETVWSGSGGGVSGLFPLPAWQNGIPNVKDTGRNLPDVSLDAGYGIAEFVNGGWHSVGGTSISAPLFAAALTEYNQFLDDRAGLFSEFLYKYFAKNEFKYAHGTSKAVFAHDMLSGCNDYNGDMRYFHYCALRGYDQASGLGSIIWQSLPTTIMSDPGTSIP